MALIKFKQAELVNLEYSLKREILGANQSGTYFNTSIIACNTRKYHGLLVVPVANLGGGKYVLLGSLDESIILNGKKFNLGIHCYGEIYEPKGHKYIIDFNDDSIPTITYKVGPITLSKEFLIAPDKDQVMIRYKVLSAPGSFQLVLKPFLPFRGVHQLTSENPVANTAYTELPSGAAFCLYEGFPTLNIQTSLKSVYTHNPVWYKGETYSDEYRRGYDCREDVLVPGTFTVNVRAGSELVVSASTSKETPASLKSRFASLASKETNVGSHRDVLLRNAKMLKVVRNGKETISAGYTWLEDGLLRETLLSLPGLTLYADGNCEEFERILDNLIADEQERLTRRTTQIEAPLLVTDVLQQYIAFGAKPADVWKKYGAICKEIIASYRNRESVTLCPNGLLWCQKYRTALSWMNTYIAGVPVTERAGYQVETNALWYNALCFAIEMESKYSRTKAGREFVKTWTEVRDSVKANYQPTFQIKTYRGVSYLADYVDNAGQNTMCRPNMLMAAYIPYQLVDESLEADIVATVNNELVTRRGIRTLSPRSAEYKYVYEGSQDSRDLAYFNGCTHTMLLGFYVDLCFRMVGSSFEGKAKWLTEGFFEDINKHGVGHFSELYDGDPPHEPHGAIASATSTAALMRCIYLMDKYNKEDKK